MTELFDIVRSLFKLIFKIVAGTTLVTLLSKVFKFRLSFNLYDFETSIEDGAFKIEHKDDSYAQCIFYILNINKGLNVFSFSAKENIEDEGKEISPKMIKLIRLILTPMRIAKGPGVVVSLEQAITKLEGLSTSEHLDSAQKREYLEKIEHCKLALKLFA